MHRRCLSTSVKRVFVGISGGVDSSVSALLLQQAGYDVVGVHMRNWDSSDEQGTAVCPADDDRKSAEAIASQLKIPLMHVDFVKEYWNDVFEPFLDEYGKVWTDLAAAASLTIAQGLTPNPDTLCNRYVKFGSFLTWAREHGADMVATGHYAMTRESWWNGHSLGAGLFQSVDPTKDQTYFLCRVRQEALESVLFPVGSMPKAQVRAIAEEHNLVTAGRKDSYGICFIGKRSLRDFLPQYMPLTPGRCVSVDDGSTVHHVDAVELFTEGQNARIPGRSCRWFVVRKAVSEGVVYVCPGASHPSLLYPFLDTPAADFNWLCPRLRDRVLGQPALTDSEWQALVEGYSPGGGTGSGGLDFASYVSGAVGERGVWCRYRIRHRQEALVRCLVVPVQGQTGSEGEERGTLGVQLRVVFEGAQRAVSPGQVVALYDDQGGVGQCYGGGGIRGGGPSYMDMGWETPADVHR